MLKSKILIDFKETKKLTNYQAAELNVNKSYSNQSFGCYSQIIFLSAGTIKGMMKDY